MGGLFGDSGKTVTAPKPKPPLAVPEVGEEVKDIARRKRPRSRQEAVITGALVPEPTGKAILG